MIDQILSYFELELIVLIIMSCSAFFKVVEVTRMRALVTFAISAIVGLAYYYLAGVDITWVKWLSSFGLATSIYDIVIKELLEFIKSKLTNEAGTHIPKS